MSHLKHRQQKRVFEELLRCRPRQSGTQEGMRMAALNENPKNSFCKRALRALEPRVLDRDVRLVIGVSEHHPVEGRPCGEDSVRHRDIAASHWADFKMEGRVLDRDFAVCDSDGSICRIPHEHNTARRNGVRTNRLQRAPSDRQGGLRDGDCVLDDVAIRPQRRVERVRERAVDDRQRRPGGRNREGDDSRLAGQGRLADRDRRIFEPREAERDNLSVEGALGEGQRAPEEGRRRVLQDEAVARPDDDVCESEGAVRQLLLEVGTNGVVWMGRRRCADQR